MLSFPLLCLEGVAPALAISGRWEVRAARRDLNLQCLIQAVCTGGSRCPWAPGWADSEQSFTESDTGPGRACGVDAAVSVCEVTRVQSRAVGISLGFQRSPLRAGRAGSKKRSSGSPRVAPLGTSRLDFLPAEKDRKITPCSGSLESLRQSGEKDQRQTSL